jgi:hypothetical protein
MPDQSKKERQMARDHRLKATEVFAGTDFVFGKKVPFAEAYPEIEDITATVTEQGRDVYDDGVRVYSKGSFGEFINCSNGRCYNGGFRVGTIVADMVRERKTESQTTRNCQGYEGSPKGRKKYRDCDNLFEVEIKIKYREQAEKRTL